MIVELPEGIFWDLIESISVDLLMQGRQAEAAHTVEHYLKRLSPEKICAFHRKLKAKLESLDTAEQLRYAKSTCTDDSFLYKRLYVIGMGREFYLTVVRDPKFMPGGYEGFEMLYNAAANAWASVTSRDASNFPDY